MYEPSDLEILSLCEDVAALKHRAHTDAILMEAIVHALEIEDDFCSPVDAILALKKEVAALTAAAAVREGEGAPAENPDMEERLFEAEAIIKERDDRLALVDKIADMIGLPEDQELDITVFQLWFSSAMLSAAPVPPEGEGGWLPIKSAPKDGTEVLLFAPATTYQGKPVLERITMGHWTTDEECQRVIGDCGGECRCLEYDYDEPFWLSWDGGFLAELPPTHWRPLPTAPREGDSK